MPEESTIKDDLNDLLNELLPAEEREQIRKDLVADLNLKINVPVIGEKIEGILISFLLRVVETVVLRLGKKYVGRVVAAIENVAG